MINIFIFYKVPINSLFIISLGPLGQSKETTGVPTEIDSISTLGKPSYMEVSNVALAYK